MCVLSSFPVHSDLPRILPLFHIKLFWVSTTCCFIIKATYCNLATVLQITIIGIASVYVYVCVCVCVYACTRLHVCMLTSQRRGSSTVWDDAVYSYSLWLVPCFRTLFVNQHHIILFSFHQFIMSATTTDMAIFHHVHLVTMLQVLQNRINTAAQYSLITHSKLLTVTVL